MPKLTVNDATIVYDHYGQGLPIVFIHGIFVSRLEWKPQLNHFTPSYQVVTCDLRGHGESGTSDTPYSVELLASDLVALLDELGLEQVVCCGHSFGGMVAQELALSYPNRIRGLVLADTVYGSWVTPWDLAFSLMTQTWMSFLPITTQMEMGARYLTLFGPTGQQAFDYVKQEMVRYLDDEATYKNILQASLKFSSRWRLHNIQCPTLVLIGEYFLQTHCQAYEMLWRIPQAKLEIIPQAGHVLNWDNPQVFNKSVEKFLTTLN